MAEVVAAEFVMAVKSPVVAEICVPEIVFEFMFRTEPVAAFVIAVKRLAAELFATTFALIETVAMVPVGMLMPDSEPALPVCWFELIVFEEIDNWLAEAF